jgi:hypothetical protein
MKASITLAKSGAIAALIACVGTTSVLAQQKRPANEFFGANSTAGVAPRPNFQGPAPKGPANGVTAKGAGAMDSDASPELTWFEKFDEESYKGRPTDYERITLNMPFNQEAERVQNWTRTAAVVAKRYRETARALQRVQAPRGRLDLERYCNLRISWFNDAAQVYEEMIRPRPPAQTIEELNDQLRQVKENANSLGKMNTSLLTMDRNLRRQYRVHNAKQTDAMTKYVTGTYQK